MEKFLTVDKKNASKVVPDMPLAACTSPSNHYRPDFLIPWRKKKKNINISL
jgi:hypothetical protein